MSLDRFDDALTRNFTNLRRAVIESPAAFPPSLRHAIATWAAGLSDDSRGAEVLPAGLANYVSKVSLTAHKVDDADVRRLREIGYSDTEIFEATVSAAVGAASAELERALDALGGA